MREEEWDVPTDCHMSHRPDLLIASAAAAQSAPSPSSPGLSRWCAGLFPWAGGGGAYAST
ncbi:MAG: hypothetical protein GY832_04700 [Chloroflexi bacterium]|nr:hypothetical protein [Chloroflexota bacterium]